MKKQAKDHVLFSEQIRNVDCKIYPQKRQDHLGRRKAMHRVSGRPDATLWTAEFQANQFQQFKGRMNKGNIKLLSWSRCLNHISIKTNFPKDMSQTKKISRFGEASQELLKDTNHTEIFDLCEKSKKRQCPDCNSFTDSGMIFFAVAGDFWSTEGVSHNFKKTTTFSIRSMATSSRKIPVEDQSMVNLNGERNAEKSKETWIPNRSLTMGRRGNISVIIDDRRVSRGGHFEFRPTCFWKTRLHSYEKRKTTILAAMGLIEK